MTDSKGQENHRPELKYWLRIALLDLEGEARGRMQAEAMERYQHVFDDGLASGLSEVEAHRAAMAELGDPWLFRSGAPYREKSLQIIGIYQALTQHQRLDETEKAVVWWLERALPDLSPRALEVVCGELVAHYHDALEAARAEGLPQAEAARRALKSLGDAGEIHTQLDRTYPDSNEYKRLRALKGYYDNPRDKFLAPLLEGLCIIVALFIMGHFWPFLAQIACWLTPGFVMIMILESYKTLRAFVFFGRRGRVPLLKYLLGTGLILILGGYCWRVATTLRLNPVSGGWGDYIAFDLLHWTDALPSVAGLLMIFLFIILHDAPLFRKIGNLKAEFENQGPDQYA